MLRTILAIITGIIAGMVVIALVETLGHMVFPPPEGVNLKDPEALKSIMHTIPLGAKLSVLIAWGLGVFAGASLARRFSEGASFASWVVGAVLLAFAGVTMVQIPHPIWMVIGAFVVTLAGIMGANAAVKPRV